MPVTIPTLDEIERVVSDAVKAALPHALAAVDLPQQEVKEVLSNREAMRFLDVSKSTLQRWRDDGLLPYSKVEGSIFYRRTDLLRVLDAHRITSK